MRLCHWNIKKNTYRYVLKASPLPHLYHLLLPSTYLKSFLSYVSRTITFYFSVHLTISHLLFPLTYSLSAFLSLPAPIPEQEAWALSTLALRREPLSVWTLDSEMPGELALLRSLFLWFWGEESLLFIMLGKYLLPHGVLHFIWAGGGWGVTEVRQGRWHKGSIKIWVHGYRVWNPCF